MNRRSFLKALGKAAVALSLPLTAPAVQAMLKSAPRWKRQITPRTDLIGVPYMVAYIVGDISLYGTQWTWVTLEEKKPDETRLMFLDSVAVKAFMRAGVLT